MKNSIGKDLSKIPLPVSVYNCVWLSGFDFLVLSYNYPLAISKCRSSLPEQHTYTKDKYTITSIKLNIVTNDLFIKQKMTMMLV